MSGISMYSSDYETFIISDTAHHARYSGHEE
jgi:hypothetical protein